MHAIYMLQASAGKPALTYAVNVFQAVVVLSLTLAHVAVGAVFVAGGGAAALGPMRTYAT